MKLLPIDIEPFARIQWPSEAAKREYGSKIQAASAAYYDLELRTVEAGMRQCTTRHVAPDDIGRVARDLARRGLTLLPLTRVGTYSGFAHRHPPVVPGRPWNWYCVVGISAAACEQFAAASDAGDHAAIGRLLGYPECCLQFFKDVWIGQRIIDPIFEQAAAYRLEHDGQRAVLDDTARPELGVHLRYIGVRLVPHLPCSYSCGPSLDMARQWLGMTGAAGEVITELLGLPYRWSCYKGIAIVDTPAFRIVTNSTPRWPEVSVETTSWGL